MPRELFVVLDLEATCPDRLGEGVESPILFPSGEEEIVEIGAVAFELVGGEARQLDGVLGAWSSLVRPTRHPTLSTTFVRLTGITQGAVATAPMLGGALRRFSLWSYTFLDAGAHLCSWGPWDFEMLDRAARECPGVQLPDLPRFDLKEKLHVARGGRRRMNLPTALRACGLAFEGPPHRAESDAFNAARTLPWAFERKPFDPAWVVPKGSPDAS